MVIDGSDRVWIICLLITTSYISLSNCQDVDADDFAVYDEEVDAPDEFGQDISDFLSSSMEDDHEEELDGVDLTFDFSDPDMELEVLEDDTAVTFETLKEINKKTLENSVPDAGKLVGDEQKHYNINQVKTSSEVKTPEINTPEFKTPEVKTPKVKIPEVKTPEVKIPDVKTPEVKTPEVKPTEIMTPEVKTPEVKTPEVKTPEIMTPVKTPEVKTPEIMTPVKTPQVKITEDEFKPRINVPENRELGINNILPLDTNFPANVPSDKKAGKNNLNIQVTYHDAKPPEKQDHQLHHAKLPSINPADIEYQMNSVHDIIPNKIVRLPGTVKEVESEPALQYEPYFPDYIKPPKIQEKPETDTYYRQSSDTTYGTEDEEFNTKMKKVLVIFLTLLFALLICSVAFVRLSGSGSSDNEFDSEMGYSINTYESLAEYKHNP